ncbi:MAG: LamB/YcsF family protein [Thermomicrobiales bacterium]
MTRVMDLNSDLGEAFGAHQVGFDDELFDLISSANVACGWHGGDPRVMERTIRICRDKGIAVGAHPGFADLVGFGRREIKITPDEARTDTLYQTAALDGFCRAAGVRMHHVKAHGAFYNAAVRNRELADGVAAGVKSFDPTLIMLAQPGTQLFAASVAAGLPTAREGFIDRGYNPDGTLVARGTPGALITDPSEASERVLRLLEEGLLRTADGSDLAIEVDSLCIHSDTPGAVAVLTRVRADLERAGVTIATFGRGQG